MDALTEHNVRRMTREELIDALIKSKEKECEDIEVKNKLRFRIGELEKELDWWIHKDDNNER